LSKLLDKILGKVYTLARWFIRRFDRIQLLLPLRWPGSHKIVARGPEAGAKASKVRMRDLLSALKGSKLIAQGADSDGRKITHYLLPDGRVLEVIQAKP
jgi:hypothetical protein